MLIKECAMPRFICIANVGKNGIAITIRDAETGGVTSFTIEPREMAETFLRAVELSPEIKIEYK
ncbi:MAG: hypothetical protein AOA65_0194 [Candidatus Bathyarchaeota archaeon BA1]|nr:MAG: hypothetical protein AOA65_0194 [Candidatus Bathyarchaeota archaeon BA1]